MLSNTVFIGFSLCLSLILAIGAQNAFVLRQGILKQYVFSVCLVCGLSDTALILLGVFGFGPILSSQPLLVQAMKYFGAGFLFYYGLKSFYAAYRAKSAISVQANSSSSFKSVILTCLAFSWLNPHAYLDTVVLIGAISAQYTDKFSFAVGAIIASVSFFFILGYAASLLRPWFSSEKAWQILDILIALSMWGIAIGLLIN